jgi:hypothetical protein
MLYLDDTACQRFIAYLRRDGLLERYRFLVNFSEKFWSLDEYRNLRYKDDGNPYPLHVLARREFNFFLERVGGYSGFLLPLDVITIPPTFAQGYALADTESAVTLARLADFSVIDLITGHK